MDAQYFALPLPESESEKQALIDWVNQHEDSLWQAFDWSPKHVQGLDAGEYVGASLVGEKTQYVPASMILKEG